MTKQEIKAIKARRDTLVRTITSSNFGLMRSELPPVLRDYNALITEIERLQEYIVTIGKKAYSEHSKGHDRCGRLYGIAEMCRPENVEAAR